MYMMGALICPVTYREWVLKKTPTERMWTLSSETHTGVRPMTCLCVQHVYITSRYEHCTQGLTVIVR